MTFPGGKKFAFTIFDDADMGTVDNAKPVYDFLADCGLRTTKSTWVYPSRGNYAGHSLADPVYREWLTELSRSGFEIGLHNVGDGAFSREEIAAGLDEFRRTFGSYPKVHVNHVSNPDNLYWWDRRFEFPLNILYGLVYFLRTRQLPPAGGDNPGSDCFWGDYCRDRITYVRNMTVNHINTLQKDKRMPYHIAGKPLVKYWFSSSDGHDLELFNQLIRKENVDALEATGGACIVYTHFAYGFVRDGVVDKTFRERIEYLSRKDGWFVPTGTLLDHLVGMNGGGDPGYLYRLRTNIGWCVDRVAKRVRFGK